jgi:phage-related protein
VAAPGEEANPLLLHPGAAATFHPCRKETSCMNPEIEERIALAQERQAAAAERQMEAVVATQVIIHARVTIEKEVAEHAAEQVKQRIERERESFSEFQKGLGELTALTRQIAEDHRLKMLAAAVAAGTAPPVASEGHS